jgi:hypothetical protein
MEGAKSTHLVRPQHAMRAPVCALFDLSNVQVLAANRSLRSFTLVVETASFRWGIRPAGSPLGGREPARGHPRLTLLPEAARGLPRPPQAGTPARDRGPDVLSDLPDPFRSPDSGTLRRWRAAILAYFDTAGTSNEPSEAVNGVIDAMRRVARGFRNFENHRRRPLLAAGDHRTWRKIFSHAPLQRGRQPRSL